MGSSSEPILEASPLAHESTNAGLEQLMVRYQQADARATTMLIEQLSPQLYRFFAAQLGNADDAQDIWNFAAAILLMRDPVGANSGP